MAALPVLLRTVLKSSMPDDDWSATQVAPSQTITADITGSAKVGCFYIARKADGTVADPSGSCDLQPVKVRQTQPLKGAAAVTVITSGAADTGVVSGQDLTYDDLANTAGFTLRVADDGSNLDAAVVSIDIYWNTITNA